MTKQIEKRKQRKRTPHSQILRQTSPPQKTPKAKLKTIIYKSSIHEVKKIIILRQSIMRHRTSKNTIWLIFFFGYLLMGVGA